MDNIDSFPDKMNEADTEELIPLSLAEIIMADIETRELQTNQAKGKQMTIKLEFEDEVSTNQTRKTLTKELSKLLTKRFPERIYHLYFDEYIDRANKRFTAQLYYSWTYNVEN